MKTIRPYGSSQEYTVPSVNGMFITLTTYAISPKTHVSNMVDERTYWVSSLDEAEHKMKNYMRYMRTKFDLIVLFAARVRDDDTNRLVATYESDRKMPWHLSVHDALGNFVKWVEYYTLLSEYRKAA